MGSSANIIDAELARLQAKIQAWATRRDLWHDCVFRPAHEHYDEPPKEHGPMFLILCGGSFHSMIDGYGGRDLDAFSSLLERNDCWYENEGYGAISIRLNNEARQQQVFRLHRMRWVQRLAAERLTDVHQELYAHFAHDPHALKQLDWRNFEIVLDSIFRNQGFRTELGPGSNDGGVDIRLYQSDSIGELVTLVQAKRYGKQPIKLDAVAALTALVDDQRANRGLLVTTSRFQPKAQRFAKDRNHVIQLADSEHVARWCRTISTTLSSFFSGGNLSDPLPPSIAQGQVGPLVGSIVHATWGYNMVINDFAVIEAEFPREIILRRIGSRSLDPNGQCGHEVPEIDSTPRNLDFTPLRLTAFRKTSKNGSGEYFWGDRRLYTLWDGKPTWFDYMD